MSHNYSMRLRNLQYTSGIYITYSGCISCIIFMLKECLIMNTVGTNDHASNQTVNYTDVSLVRDGTVPSGRL